MEKNQSEMQKIVEGFVKELSKKGVKVSSAAILNINDNDAAKSDVGNFMAQAMKNLEKIGFKPEQKQELPKEKSEERNQCFCPNCFNYESFEEMLNQEPGAKEFFYKEIDCNGVIFDIKVCKYETRDYDFMIQKREAQPDQFAIDPTWTVDQLNEGLNNAVRNKNFDYAQAFLNALNRTKTNQ